MNPLTAKLTFIFLLVRIISYANGESHFTLASYNFNDGKYDSTIWHLDQLTQTTWETAFLKSRAYIELGEYQKSIQWINEALTTYDSGKIDFTLLKAKLFFQMGEPQQSIDLIDSLGDLTNREHNARALNIKAKSLIWAGFIDKAIGFNHQAFLIASSLEVKDYILLGDIANVDGILAYFRGDYDQAIDKFEEAIDNKRKIYSDQNPEVLSLFGNTGVMYKNKLQYDKALEYYGYELENLILKLGENHPDVATSYQNIGGVLFEKGSYELALKAFNKALEIKVAVLGEGNTRTLDLLEWIANVQANIGQYDEALSGFEKTLEGRVEELGYNNHYVLLTEYNIGETYLKQANYNEAIKHFSFAKKIGEVVYESKNADQATNYIGIGESYRLLGQIDSSRWYFYKSLEEILPDFEWQGELNPPTIDAYLRFAEVSMALIGLSKTFNTIHSKPSDIEQGLHFINTARIVLDNLRQTFINESDRITFQKYGKDLADAALELVWRKYELTGEGIDELFKWTEYSKSVALLTTMVGEKAKLESDIPDSMLLLDYRYRVQQDSLKTLLLENDVSRMADLRNELLRISNDHHELINQLEQDYPAYAEQKYGVDPVELTKLKSKLKGVDFVIYHISSSKNLMIHFINDHNHVVKKEETHDVNGLISNLRESIIEQSDTGYQELSFQLSKLLIDPIKEYLNPDNRLVIVPDGILSYVPFDALPFEDGYLFESHRINYEFSATIFSNRITNQKKSARFIAYASKFENNESKLELLRSEDLYDLPGAQREAQMLADLMNGTLVAGAEATESRFKKEMSSYDIIHLATHSIVAPYNPDYSRLYLGKTEDDDGLLHAYELGNLNLSASLVTLSACNTGFGQIAEGEGVISIARTFSAVGVPSVVMSLWPASDKSTPELMKYFYQNLKDGKSKDVALNNARKQYLSTAKGKARHPFYWGGFVLIGDESPIVNRTIGKTYWLILIVILILVIPIGFKLYREMM
ncbi:MAG: hypothetical protein CMP48_25695 [Rickettsiales bacterium]|nr:hypothetical protein [Rickettsiales bacterium]